MYLMKRQDSYDDSCESTCTCESAWTQYGRILVGLLIILLILGMLLFGLHARRRLDEGRMPIYGTGWLGRYYKWRRDRLHESTRPPGATKPTEAQELTRPNDPYPGIQEVDGHVTEATFARGTVEMEAAQTGAGAYPFRERRKSVVVNVEPVELPAGERE